MEYAVWNNNHCVMIYEFSMLYHTDKQMKHCNAYDIVTFSFVQ